MFGKGLWKGTKKMTREEFMKTAGRLQEMYNRKLNDTQLDFWFDELKKFEAEKVRRAVGEYIKQNRTMPTIADILERIKNLKPLGSEAQDGEITKAPCETCKGSGLVKYYKDEYEYLCRCYCENGKAYQNMAMLRDYKDVFYYRTPPKIEAEPLDIDISQINF